MKALTYFNQAIELEKEGEDGSSLLSLLCGDFELAQLWSAVETSHPYRYLVDDARRTRRAVEAR